MSKKDVDIVDVVHSVQCYKCHGYFDVTVPPTDDINEVFTNSTCSLCKSTQIERHVKEEEEETVDTQTAIKDPEQSATKVKV